MTRSSVVPMANDTSDVRTRMGSRHYAVERPVGDCGSPCHSSSGRGPQIGPPSCVGEGSDGERTHRCHRRCGSRGQVGSGPRSGGTQLWTTPWMTTCTTEGCCGWRCVVTSGPSSCTRRAQRRPHPVVGRSGGLGPPPGVRREWPAPRHRARRARVWTSGGRGVDEARRTPTFRVLPGMHKVVHTLGTCGRREGVPRDHARISGGTQLGISLWTTSDARVSVNICWGIDRPIVIDRQPACCLIRFVSSVTWL